FFQVKTAFFQLFSNKFINSLSIVCGRESTNMVMKSFSRKIWQWSAGSLLAVSVSATAYAQDVIRIGEINSYKTIPAFLEPYKKGIDLAVEQINQAGGLNGKKVEVL